MTASVTMTTSESARLERVRTQARKEIEEDDFAEAVERYKVKLRKQKWWHRLLPIKILIVRRDNRG